MFSNNRCLAEYFAEKCKGTYEAGWQICGYTVPAHVEKECGECSEKIYALHDIGRHFIPFAILNKVGGLSEEEKQMIKDHTINARKAIRSIYIQPFPDEIMEQWEKIAVYHHERFDGGGYPEGKKGEEIPIGARICAIADTYDGIVSWKPYKKKQTTKEEAVRIIEEEAGGQFQPELVEIFRECIDRF